MKMLLILSFQITMLHAFAQLQPVPSGVMHWNDLIVKKQPDRESRKIAEGTTPEFEFFEIHATTQNKNAAPKPSHAQKDKEELIIIKEGKMKCSIGDTIAVLGPGSVLLIPPLQSQTFENVGDGPLTYYVFQFRSKKPMDIERSIKAGGSLVLNIDSLEFKPSTKGGGRKYFDRPTAMCENFEMHVTKLDHKGPSHNPHQHIDTEIILVIDGQVEMMIEGKTFSGGPGDIFIAESGKLHGVGNATEKPCSYFAFKWR